MGSVSALTPSGGVSWVPKTTSIVFVGDDDFPLRESLKPLIPCAGQAAAQPRPSMNCLDTAACKCSARFRAVYNQWTI
jgi:hypothetical protein